MTLNTEIGGFMDCGGCKTHFKSKLRRNH